MDETKARALLTELSALREGEKPKVMPLILAFEAEVRRDERERALVAVLRLTADDAAKYGGRQAAIAALRALSDAPGATTL